MRLPALLVVLLVLSACGAAGQQAGSRTGAAQSTIPTTAGAAALSVTSPAFEEGAAIPRKYTCSAENISPPLAWSGLPPGAKSLALIADDPDAPAGTWTHWVLFNLPATSTGLPEGVKPQDSPEGAIQATTSFRRVGYGGPCPPSGTHRYYFRLYALDTALTLGSGATAADVRAAMQEHVVGEGPLMGRYSH